MQVVVFLMMLAVVAASARTLEVVGPRRALTQVAVVAPECWISTGEHLPDALGLSSIRMHSCSHYLQQHSQGSVFGSSTSCAAEA